jgi:hypothetical protein
MRPARTNEIARRTIAAAAGTGSGTMTAYFQNDIEGSWRLCSWRIEYDGSRAPTAPFGDRPGGLLIYTSDGWMSATVCRADRQPFAVGASPRTQDDRRVAEAFRSYFHYAGTYRVEDDRVIHSVRYSLNPGLVGTEQIRRLRIDGGLLTLTGVDRAGNTERRHELVWQRLPSGSAGGIGT